MDLGAFKGLLPSESIKALEKEASNTTVLKHHESLTPATGRSQPGFGPILTVIGTTVGLQYSAPASDKAFRTLQIDHRFVGEASFHIHWTKSGNGDESGNTVQWRIRYTVYDGESEDITVAPRVIDYIDTYTDAGTTTRIVHRTPNLPADGWIAGHYVGIEISVVSAGTTLASDPILIAGDVLCRSDVEDPHNDEHGTV